MPRGPYGRTFIADGSPINAAGTTWSTAVAVPSDIPAGNLNVQLNISAMSGTSPSLTVTIEWSGDGTNFATFQPGAEAFTAITATGNTVRTFPIKGSFWRLRYVVAGTTPSVTFSATAFVN